jgi:hypothetical protein
VFGVWNLNIDGSIVFLKVLGTIEHQTSCVFTFHVMNTRFKKKKLDLCLVFITHKFGCYFEIHKVKGKAIPLQAWIGPKGSRRLMFPGFKTFGS